MKPRAVNIYYKIVPDFSMVPSDAFAKNFYW